MKKNFIFIFAFSCLINFGAVKFGFAQNMVGKWKTIDDETGKEKSIIQIFKAKDGKYYGQVKEVLDKTRGENPLCDKCTDDRKGKPVKGMYIINDMVLSGETLSGGRILDPQKGKEYSCKIWLEGSKLKVRGYWGIFYRTQTWHKAE